MHKIDEALCYRRKNNQVELTDNGIQYLSGDTDADFYPTRHWNCCQYRKEKIEKDKPKKRKLFQDFGIKASNIHTLTQLF
jgi:preprotein translocase subunit SecA